MDKMLFFVSCYSHGANYWARFLLTVPQSDDHEAMRQQAVRDALASLPPDYSNQRAAAIQVCPTNTDVYREV